MNLAPPGACKWQDQQLNSAQPSFKAQAEVGGVSIMNLGIKLGEL